MTQASPVLLSAQDVGEAQGALTGLLTRALDGSDVSTKEWVVMRVVTGRGPWASLSALQAYLESQPQLDRRPPGRLASQPASDHLPGRPGHRDPWCDAGG